MLDIAQNLVRVTVSGTYDAIAYSITLAPGQGAKLNAAGGYNVVWWNVTDYPDPSLDPNVEITRVASVSGDVVTLVNNGTARTEQEGIVPSTKNIAGKTYLMIATLTAKMIADIQAALIAGTRYPWQVPGKISGIIDGTNRTFTLPWIPQDPNSLVLYLNQQPYFVGVHFEYNGDGTVTYLTAPDASFAGTGHYAIGQ
jgi:hypothetical protein